MDTTNHTKSRKTLKRTRTATSPARFGEALESLLATAARDPDAGTKALTLVRRRHKEETLERGARKVLAGEKREREEMGRVRDVIGGWGVEGERALRKVAQRGVITLFNAVQQAQTPMSNEDAGEPSKMHHHKNHDDQERFLDIIRAGGVVSKA